MRTDAAGYVTEHRRSVRGWFDLLDAWMFVAADRACPDQGDLLEIGAYLGRSAILLGYLARENEDVIVVDLFGAPAPTDEQIAEQARWYGGLTRDAFLANWRRFHEREPSVLVGRSDEMLPTLPPASCRLIHIDGSHEYAAVRSDIDDALRLATPSCVLIFDDIISPHTPGVTAAVWGAALEGLVVPLVQTMTKLYATVPGSALSARHLAATGTEFGGIEMVESHRVADFDVWEVAVPPAPSVPASPRGLRAWIPPIAVRAGRSVRQRLRRPSTATSDE